VDIDCYADNLFFMVEVVKVRHLEELKEKYKDGWWEGHDGYSGDEMCSDIKYLFFVVGEYKEAFEKGYERGKQANVRIGELLNENKELKQLTFDLGEENEQLRKRNEELLKEAEHWKNANKYNLNVCRNQSNLVGVLHRIIKQYEELIGAIANIDGAFITGEGECDYTDKQALDKIMEWVDPVWSEIAQWRRKDV
jgi:hypothetical protein